MSIKMKYLTIGLILLLNGCALFGVGHGYLKVTGELLNEKGQKLENCLVQMSELTIAGSKNISGEFTVLFSVEPKKREYTLIFNCPDKLVIEKKVKFSGFENPSNLGEIVFNEKNS